jgi:hypothetical protein
MYAPLGVCWLLPTAMRQEALRAQALHAACCCVLSLVALLVHVSPGSGVLQLCRPASTRKLAGLLLACAHCTQHNETGFTRCIWCLCACVGCNQLCYSRPRPSPALQQYMHLLSGRRAAACVVWRRPGGRSVPIACLQTDSTLHVEQWCCNQHSLTLNLAQMSCETCKVQPSSAACVCS